MPRRRSRPLPAPRSILRVGLGPGAGRAAAPALFALLAPLVLVALGGCGRGDSAQPLVRVLDRAAEARVESPADLRAAEPVLEAAALGPDDWRPVFRIEEEHTPADLAEFRAHSRVREDGALELGGERGSWMHWLRFEGGGPLFVEADVDFAGLAAGGPRGTARLGVIELATDEEPESLAAARDVLTGGSWCPDASRAGGTARLSLLFRTSPETRSIAILCTFVRPAERAGARAVFRDLRLAVPGERELAERLATLPLGSSGARPFDSGGPDRTGGAGAARYSIGFVSRPGIGVLPGATVSVPVALPPGPSVFDVWLGLPPGDFYPAGQRVALACSWSAERDGPRLPVLRNTLLTRAGAEAYWLHVASQLPDAARERTGRDSWLHFSAEPWEGGPPRDPGENEEEEPAPAARPLALAVFGAPEIVPDEVARPGPNVVVVSLDTLRADHVGTYGYPRPTTPNLDALAAESLVFEDVWANAPYTLPSHVSLFSGQVPSVHGVERPAQRVSPERSTLLAQILAARGYATAAFTGGAMVLPEFGFGRGFDRYGSLDPAANLESSRTVEALTSVPGVTLELLRRNGTPAVTSWIEEHARQPFFLFVHTYAAHEFDPPLRHLQALGLKGAALVRDPALVAYLGNREEPTPLARKHLVDLYDGGVRQADELVGAVVGALREHELLDRTLLVVTSDHGKEIGEHGSVGHGHTLYEELLRVPLVVRVPGRGHRRVAAPAMLVDVLPTVLEALDLPAPPGTQGASLLALAAGDVDPRPLWAEVDNMALKRALRRGELKTIWSPLDADVPFANEVEEESFDLAKDPGELHPLAPDAARLARVEDMEATLRALGASLGGTDADGRPLDDTARAYLGALGYGESLPDAGGDGRD